MCVFSQVFNHCKGSKIHDLHHFHQNFAWNKILVSLGSLPTHPNFVGVFASAALEPKRLGGPELGCGPGGPEPDGKRPTGAPGSLKFNSSPLKMDGWFVGSDEFPQLGFPIFTGANC